MQSENLKASTLPAIGAPLGGGFFAGRFQIDSTHFALVVSPGAGDTEGQWGEYGKKLETCRSMIDGKQNTIDLAESGSELARAISQLDIGGYSDWFLPARDQLELLYRNLKPTDDSTYCSYMDGHNTHSVPPGDLYENDAPEQTSVEEFLADGTHALQPTWYWSSTQYSAYGAFSQDFENGLQTSYDKNFKFRARAVRQIQLVIE